MNKKYSYVGISFVLLLFGIYVVRNLDRRINENDLVQEDRLNKIDKQDDSTSALFTLLKYPIFNLSINMD